MRVRLLFFCPRCGSLSFRPSMTRRFRDSVLASFGVHPHRCYMCRLRFYMFKPSRLRGWVEALDRPWLGRRDEAIPAALEAAKRRPVARQQSPARQSTAAKA